MCVSSQKDTNIFLTDSTLCPASAHYAVTFNVSARCAFPPVKSCQRDHAQRLEHEEVFILKPLISPDLPAGRARASSLFVDSLSASVFQLPG
eukprot:307907-Pelagomonas_calceolata.AAC.5